MKILQIILFCCLFGVILSLSCSPPSDSKEQGANQRTRKELLIYSGMTMISPLMELAALFEKQENCTIRLSYGGSLHIENSIKINQVGDLYLPGDETFINPFVEDGTVIDTREVGYNQAVIMVQKGNPKKINNDMLQFTDRFLAVVIGAENGGAIGRETKNIFSELGIYDDVVQNAIYLSTDSKGLARAIRNNDADLTINWKAMACLPENRESMDMIGLGDRHSRKKKLVMGLLSYSRNKNLARKFLDLAVSDQGREIFRGYGFLD